MLGGDTSCIFVALAIGSGAHVRLGRTVVNRTAARCGLGPGQVLQCADFFALSAQAIDAALRPVVESLDAEGVHALVGRGLAFALRAIENALKHLQEYLQRFQT